VLWCLVYYIKLYINTFFHFFLITALVKIIILNRSNILIVDDNGIFIECSINNMQSSFHVLVSTNYTPLSFVVCFQNTKDIFGPAYCGAWGTCNPCRWAWLHRTWQDWSVSLVNNYKEIIFVLFFAPLTIWLAM